MKCYSIGLSVSKYSKKVPTKDKEIGNWVKVSGVVDSGAIVSVTPTGEVPWIKAKPSAGSRRGDYYTSASNGKIYNERGLEEGFSSLAEPP